MTDSNSSISVACPDKWLNGWDNYYKKLLEAPDEKLADLSFIIHPVQCLLSSVSKMETKPRALELACGHGITTCALAKAGCTVDANDALPSAVEVTKKRSKVVGVSDKVSVSLKDMDGWPVENNKYGVIVATQCLQYLFDRAVPRLRELAAALQPGGFLVYCGNIPPHFKTEPPMRFISADELRTIFEGWTFHSFGRDERLLRPEDLRGYLWLVAQKPTEK